LSDPEWKSPPTRSTGDALHSIVKSALALGAGPLAELFSFLVQSPFEKRMLQWMERCEMRFRHLAARDRTIVEALPTNEEFVSVFIAATQAAIRTHHQDKRRMLASAVEHSAIGAGIERYAADVCAIC
jgi:hypothetical protein